MKTKIFLKVLAVTICAAGAFSEKASAFELNCKAFNEQDTQHKALFKVAVSGALGGQASVEVDLPRAPAYFTTSLGSMNTRYGSLIHGELKNNGGTAGDIYIEDHLNFYDGTLSLGSGAAMQSYALECDETGLN